MSAALPFPGRPTWAEIDLDALAENYQALASLLERPQGTGPGAPSPRLIPVIKADAYGHGAFAAARRLAREGAECFAVALAEEGAALVEAGISEPILVLEGAWPGQEKEVLRHRLVPAVYSPEGIRRLESAAGDLPGSVPVHVKIDTGMTRLGVPWDSVGKVADALRGSKRLRVTGTFTHLASAEEEDSAFNEEQSRRFRRALASIRAAGIDPGEIHLANSAALLHWPPSRSSSARPGIALYGYPPAPDRTPVQMKPVFTLKTKIGRIHTIRPGESVGYNRRFLARRTTRCATLPVGYADGYSRLFSGRGKVIIRDCWAEVLGAVSMDMIVVDVTGIPEAGEGEDVVLLGTSPHCRMDAAVWAEMLGTIPYEVLCRVGARVPRVYTAMRGLSIPAPAQKSAASSGPESESHVEKPHRL